MVAGNVAFPGVAGLAITFILALQTTLICFAFLEETVWEDDEE